MKFKFLSLTSIFGIAVISVLSLATTYEFAQAGPSSYQKTCHTERILGSFLLATCQTPTNGPRKTSLLLRGIYNINGHLVQNILNSGTSYRNSCKNFSVKNGVLSATCLNNNQRSVKNSIMLQEITNHDGNLVYEFDAYKKETAKKIANGHGYVKHLNDFQTNVAAPAPIIFEKIAFDVMQKKLFEKDLADGRKAYWKSINPSNYLNGTSTPKGTIVIVNPRDPDRGTMFVPSQGMAYFNKLK